MAFNLIFSLTLTNSLADEFTSGLWLRASSVEDEVVQSKAASISSSKKYATFFAMIYLSLYQISVSPPAKQEVPIASLEKNTLGVRNQS